MEEALSNTSTGCSGPSLTLVRSDPEAAHTQSSFSTCWITTSINPGGLFGTSDSRLGCPLGELSHLLGPWTKGRTAAQTKNETAACRRKPTPAGV